MLLKTYTLDQIKAYAIFWLKPAFCTDAKDSVPENERLQAFLHFIDKDDDSHGMEQFVQQHDKNIAAIAQRGWFK